MIPCRPDNVTTATFSSLVVPLFWVVLWIGLLNTYLTAGLRRGATDSLPRNLGTLPVRWSLPSIATPGPIHPVGNQTRRDTSPSPGYENASRVRRRPS